MILHTVYTHIFLLQQLKEEVQRQMDQQNQLQMKYANLSMDKQHLFIQGHIA